MQTLIDSLRSVIGTADFYDVTAQAWDYSAMFEYFSCVLIVLVVVASVFRLIAKAVR